EFALLNAVQAIPLAVIRNRTKQARRLFREIELLHPQVSDGGRRPDNCEYPWDDGAGRILVPAEHHFEALRLVDQQGGPQILKIVEAAINDLCQ
ncbi:MAG TPA: hypothetical protein VK137_06650, partial [Planctomycetaceae bacterium]|nr:hypothetical protein [Planctomycetaceae bacterium]